MADILGDTNVFLRYISPESAQYELVSNAIEVLISSGHRLLYSPQVLREMWNVMTRPLIVNGQGVSIRTADAGAKLIEEMFDILQDTDVMHTTWRRLVVEHEVRGVQVHDARLAASALAGGCRAILTLNDPDFKRFGVSAIHPARLTAYLANGSE